MSHSTEPDTTHSSRDRLDLSSACTPLPPEQPQLGAITKASPLTGCLIALEGLDGAGKTSQAARLAQELAHLGHDVVQRREPGNTPTGRFLSQYLREGGPTHPVAAAGLFLAAHAELMCDTVLPDLRAGRIVVMDRFTPSCIAYQCCRDRVPEAPIRQLHEHIHQGPLPAHYILLDIHPQTSVSRSLERSRRTDDPNELANLSQRTTTREGYLAQAAEEPDLWSVIDAETAWETVAERILARVISTLASQPTHHTD